MGYAFISYSTKNQSSADAMRTLFNKHQIDTWMAPYDIPVGREYAEVITQAIRGCACFVLLLSDGSQSSKPVRKEVELAVLNFERPIIPVQIETIMLNDAFLFYLHNQQIVSVPVIDESVPEIAQLLQVVHAHTAKNTSTFSVPENESDSLHHNTVGAHCYTQLFSHLTDLGKRLPEIDTAKLLKKTTVLQHTDPAYVHQYEPQVAEGCYDLAYGFWDRNDTDNAEIFFRDAHQIWRRLTEENPDIYEEQLADVCSDLALLLQNTLRGAEAKELLQEELDLYQYLATNKPDQYELRIAETCVRLADAMWYTEDDPVVIEARYREAFAIYRKHMEQSPDAYDLYDTKIAEIYYKLAELLRLLFLGFRDAEAFSFYQEALEIHNRKGTKNGCRCNCSLQNLHKTG